jgi:hypothetical protein
MEAAFGKLSDEFARKVSDLVISFSRIRHFTATNLTPTCCKCSSFWHFHIQLRISSCALSHHFIPVKFIGLFLTEDANQLLGWTVLRSFWIRQILDLGRFSPLPQEVWPYLMQKWINVPNGHSLFSEDRSIPFDRLLELLESWIIRTWSRDLFGVMDESWFHWCKSFSQSRFESDLPTTCCRNREIHCPECENIMMKSWGCC